MVPLLSANKILGQFLFCWNMQAGSKVFGRLRVSAKNVINACLIRAHTRSEATDAVSIFGINGHHQFRFQSACV
jgi:hypothetical protein